MENDGKTEKLLKRIHPYDTDYLYKYRSMDSMGLENIFSRNEIYHSDPISFNDPFDCKPLLVPHKSRVKRNEYYKSIIREKFPRATRNEIKEQIKKNPRLRWLESPAGLEKIFIEFIKGFGLYCLSEVPDDILMWSHYSASHKGICLQFKADSERTLFWEAFKVAYQEEYPKVNIMDMGKQPQFFDLFATKSNHWEYEQERRIIKTPQEGGAQLYSFQPELLTGVILGAKISKDDEEVVKGWIKKHKTPIQIYRAKMNKEAYRLDISGINC